MKIEYLLDTCAWLDLSLNPQVVGQETLNVVSAQTLMGISPVSCIEISRKIAAGQLALSQPIAEWMESASDSDLIRLLDISPAIAIEAYALPGDFHKDPADRLIVATARVHQLTIITSDRKILDYRHVRTLSTR